jgi:uncharacterized membrane protein YjgN (DUF898 family)
MTGLNSDAINSQHSFVFHGKGGAFFILCLVNLLLTIVTLGIYFPWALVKSRRYVYENMELSGARFQYRATGGAFFISWIVTLVVVIALFAVFNGINPDLKAVPVIIIICVMPLLVMKGLRFQSMMTALNGIRFGFHCPLGKAYWVMLGLPILLVIGGSVLLTFCVTLAGQPSDITSLLRFLIVCALLGLLLASVTNALLYGKWLQLLGESASFGHQRFSVAVSLKRCFVISMAATLIVIPFLIVIFQLLKPMYVDLFMMISMAGSTHSSGMAIASEYQGAIIACYFLYFAAILTSSAFMTASMRNLFVNGLKLGDTLRFRSTLSLHGLLIQYLTIAAATILTLGLAYPWAKIRLLRYLAKNTFLLGDLDALECVDSDESVDTGFLAILSRGAAPAVPFL